MTRRLISIVLILYSAIATVLVALARAGSLFSPKIKNQLADRPTVAETAALLLERKKKFKKSALFFCSSAGEYEQARPLIDRLNARGDFFVHTLIFSRSGLDYAKARAEPVSFSLSPATDSVWDWGWIFTALRPSLVIAVRHELWPGFIWSAKNYGSVQLINASCSLGESASILKKWVRATIFKMFEKIYVVSETDARFFKSAYSISQDLVLVTGDTKYDRVFERTQIKNEDPAQLDSKNKLRAIFDLSPDKNRLIIGSAHPADLDLFIKSHIADPSLLDNWLVIIAPHHIDRANIHDFEQKLQKAGLQTSLFSTSNHHSDLKKTVLILDTMGMLAEAYSLATAAFVGGASHYQVHNVLEPAIHGLALAWGTFYKNSQEAVTLVDSRIASVVSEAGEFNNWLHQARNHKSGNDNATTKAVRSFCGASDLIYNEWKSILNG